ncbi:hypothetical protein G7K_2310-t1 [Saitoella complicata NRRL Y-17804]|uniref:EH domain-containing protein n=2 Tax=Saitoella complicata (strain BCRC 22490 / CBS 7301 / JCM 7358 / NBRC 10748 / NRRL Y-17804) TaxID=698492 RepID=A0A0E9NEK5_SAICN|nr:hypothetical protein G7K_2310-t1 [Saitoella complicata NRRL Y-17804]
MSNPSVNGEKLGAEERRAYKFWWTVLHPAQGRISFQNVMKFLKGFGLGIGDVTEILALFPDSSDGLLKEEFFAMVRVVGRYLLYGDIDLEMVERQVPVPENLLYPVTAETPDEQAKERSSSDRSSISNEQSVPQAPGSATSTTANDQAGNPFRRTLHAEPVPSHPIDLHSMFKSPNPMASQPATAESTPAPSIFDGRGQQNRETPDSSRNNSLREQERSAVHAPPPPPPSRGGNSITKEDKKEKEKANAPPPPPPPLSQSTSTKKVTPEAPRPPAARRVSASLNDPFSAPEPPPPRKPPTPSISPLKTAAPGPSTSTPTPPRPPPARRTSMNLEGAGIGSATPPRPPPVRKVSMDKHAPIIPSPALGSPISKSPASTRRPSADEEHTGNVPQPPPPRLRPRTSSSSSVNGVRKEEEISTATPPPVPATRHGRVLSINRARSSMEVPVVAEDEEESTEDDMSRRSSLNVAGSEMGRVGFFGHRKTNSASVSETSLPGGLHRRASSSGAGQAPPPPPTSRLKTVTAPEPDAHGAEQKQQQAPLPTNHGDDLNARLEELRREVEALKGRYS